MRLKHGNHKHTPNMWTSEGLNVRFRRENIWASNMDNMQMFKLSMMGIFTYICVDDTGTSMGIKACKREKKPLYSLCVCVNAVVSTGRRWGEFEHTQHQVDNKMRSIWWTFNICHHHRLIVYLITQHIMHQGGSYDQIPLQCLPFFPKLYTHIHSKGFSTLTSLYSPGFS